MNINLREEETNAYVAIYQNYLDDIQRLNSKVNNVLNEIMEQSKYDQLQRQISTIVDIYMETIVNNIETGVFSTWQESDGSLRTCLKTYQAGEAADAVCIQIEQQINDLMIDILKIEKADIVITERPIVSEEGLERLEDIFKSAQTEIRDLKSDYISRIDNKADENDIYGTLKPLVEGISANMETFFEASLHSFENLHYFVRGISLQLHNIAEENSAVSGDRSEEKQISPDLATDNFSAKKQGKEKLTFEGENFSDENIKLFVVVVERIVNQVGVDELNSSVERHYTTLSNIRNAYSRKASKGTASIHNIAENTYGRYTVTRKSIQAMVPVCNEVNSIFEPIDKFYKEKFESLGKGFEKANTIIHAISSFCGLWGLGTWNLSKMFSTTESDSSTLEKIQLGGVALAECNIAGEIINGGAHMLKIMDSVMPLLKKSKTLVKLSEKVWNLTRQDIQIPYIHKLMDQYMMEHYEINYGMTKGQSGWFEYYHNVVKEIKDNHQRRAFENSIFAAETFMPQHYTINESNPQKYREISCGIFLNLVRSGMCSKQDIESGTSNDIVDKLYNLYTSKENIKPRVDINPDRRAIG